MKTLEYFFFSLLALILFAYAATFILSKVLHTDQYVLKFSKKASMALGRDVSVGHLGLGLSMQGLSLDAWPVTIADDPGFTEQPFVKIDRVRISFDLKALFFQHQIHLTHILIESPEVHFIRSEQGQFNIQSIASLRHPALPLQETEDNGPISKEMPDTPDLASTISPLLNGNMVFKDIRPLGTIKYIRIKDGSISFIDQSKVLPLDVWLRHININLKGFSLSKPFLVLLDASFYSSVPNVHVETLVSSLAGEGDSLKIDLDAFRLLMDFSRLDVAGLKGISPDMMDNSFIKDIAGVIKIDMDHLNISSAGLIEADGKMEIIDGIIRNFNIIKMIFSETLGGFGIAGDNVENFLKDHLGSQLGSEDTTIDKAQVQFSYHDSILSIEDSLVQTNFVEAAAKGTIDQQLNVDMQTSMHLNPEASNALVEEFKGFKTLMDDSSRIAVDATLKGTIPHLKYKPNKDFRKKSKRALMQEGADILGALLGGK